MLYAIVAVIVLILDQAMKYWANVNLQLHETARLIPGLLQLTRVHNTGAAFGLFQDSAAGRWIFVGLALVVTVIVVVVLARKMIQGALGRWSLLLLVSGALGNAIDRAINGYVVDMFQFPFEFPLIGDFPVFNVADIFITVFGIVFCLYILLHREEAEAETPKKAAEPARALRRSASKQQPEPAIQADYITQLSKPVVEGKKSIERERELRLKAAEAEKAKPVDSEDYTITDWDELFESKIASKAPQNPAPAEESGARGIARQSASPPAKPEATRRPAPMPAAEASSLFKELQDNPVIVPPAPKGRAAPEERAVPKDTSASAPKKSGSEFNLDDILAEFRDS
jgi:signal peptidase II